MLENILQRFQTLKDFSNVHDINIRPVEIKLGGKALKISLYSLFQGGVVCILIYLSILFILIAREDQTIQTLQSKMSMASIVVDRNYDPVTEKNLKKKEKDADNLADSPLIPAPIEGVYRETDKGLLPKIRLSDMQTPFGAYKKPFANPRNKPLISVVLYDFGVSDRISERAIQFLPPEVSLILSPYATNSDNLQKQARADAHELWLHLPLEAAEHHPKEGGPYTILSRMSLKYNIDNLQNSLTSASGYAGLAAFSDDTFKSSEPMFRNLIKEIYQHGLAYFELNQSDPSPLVKKVSSQMQGPYMKNNIWIDDEKWLGNRDKAFEVLETLASGRGSAIGIIKPYPETLASFELWKSNLEERGFKLAPLSYLYPEFKVSDAVVNTLRLEEEQRRMEEAAYTIPQGIVGEKQGQVKLFEHMEEEAKKSPKPAEGAGGHNAPAGDAGGAAH